MPLAKFIVVQGCSILNLPFLGKGYGRRVYDRGDGWVVKWAKRACGVPQNLAEAEISRIEDSPLLAKVAEISEDGRWLVMEKLEPVADIAAVCEYFSVKKAWYLREVPELRDLVDRHQIEWGDLGRAQNWGTRNGVPAILDYGFTSDVKLSMFRPRPTCR